MLPHSNAIIRIFVEKNHTSLPLTPWLYQYKPTFTMLLSDISLRNHDSNTGTSLIVVNGMKQGCNHIKQMAFSGFIV